MREDGGRWLVVGGHNFRPTARGKGPAAEQRVGGLSSLPTVIDSRCYTVGSSSAPVSRRLRRRVLPPRRERITSRVVPSHQSSAMTRSVAATWRTTPRLSRSAAALRWCPRRRVGHEEKGRPVAAPFLPHRGDRHLMPTEYRRRSRRGRRERPPLQAGDTTGSRPRPCPAPLPGANRTRGATWAPANSSRAASITSPSTAVEVGSPPAPGPENSSCPIDGP